MALFCSNGREEPLVVLRVSLRGQGRANAPLLSAGVSAPSESILGEQRGIRAVKGRHGK